MDCAICLEPIEFTQKRTLRCEHMFHKNCIMKCKIKCPICREPLVLIGVTDNKNNDEDIYKILDLINTEELLASDTILSIDFIKKYKNNIDLYNYITSLITNHIDPNIVLPIIKECQDELYWSGMSLTIGFTIEELYAYRDYLNWDFINRDFTLDELKLLKNYVKWIRIRLDKYNYTLDDLILLIDYINWTTFKFDSKFYSLPNWIQIFVLLQDNLNSDWNHFSKILKIDQIPDHAKSIYKYINWSIYMMHNKDFIETKQFRNILFDIKDNDTLNWNYIQVFIRFNTKELNLYKNHIDFKSYNFKINNKVKRIDLNPYV